MNPICVDIKASLNPYNSFCTQKPLQSQHLYQLTTQYHNSVTVKTQVLSAAHKRTRGSQKVRFPILLPSNNFTQ